MARLLAAVDKHDREVTRVKLPLSVVWQVGCHNSIALLFTDYSKSFNIAVNRLVKREGKEVFLFVLHAGTCRRDLIVGFVRGVHVDTCTPKVL